MAPVMSFLFPGQRPRKPVSHVAMRKTLGRMGRDDITVHGFRSTFRDWVEETTALSGSVAEAALVHVVGDKVEAANRRGDLFEKRCKLWPRERRSAGRPRETRRLFRLAGGRAFKSLDRPLST
jgi:hypothetical protein